MRANLPCHRGPKQHNPLPSPDKPKSISCPTALGFVIWHGTPATLVQDCGFAIPVARPTEVSLRPCQPRESRNDSACSQRHISTACSSSPGDLESWPLPGKHCNRPGQPQQRRPFRNQWRRRPRHRSYRCRPLRSRRRTTCRSWLLRPDRLWSRNPATRRGWQEREWTKDTIRVKNM